jgi:hypothetical protein
VAGAALLMACKSGGERLAQTLPSSPPGWKLGTVSGQDLSGVGSKGVASYTPTGASQGVASVDVYVYRFDAAESKPSRSPTDPHSFQFKSGDDSERSQLRKYPFETTSFYASVEVAGQKGEEMFSAVDQDHYLLSVFPSPTVAVDVIAHKGGDSFANGAKPAVHAIAEAIDYGKLTAAQ